MTLKEIQEYYNLSGTVAQQRVIELGIKGTKAGSVPRGWHYEYDREEVLEKFGSMGYKPYSEYFDLRVKKTDKWISSKEIQERWGISTSNVGRRIQRSPFPIPYKQAGKGNLIYIPEKIAELFFGNNRRQVRLREFLTKGKAEADRLWKTKEELAERFSVNPDRIRDIVRRPGIPVSWKRSEKDGNTIIYDLMEFRDAYEYWQRTKGRKRRRTTTLKENEDIGRLEYKMKTLKMNPYIPHAPHGTIDKEVLNMMKERFSRSGFKVDSVPLEELKDPIALVELCKMYPMISSNVLGYALIRQKELKFSYKRRRKYFEKEPVMESLRKLGYLPIGESLIEPEPDWENTVTLAQLAEESGMHIVAISHLFREFKVPFKFTNRKFFPRNAAWFVIKNFKILRKNRSVHDSKERNWTTLKELAEKYECSDKTIGCRLRTFDKPVTRKIVNNKMYVDADEFEESYQHWILRKYTIHRKPVLENRSRKIQLVSQWKGRNRALNEHLGYEAPDE